MRPGLAFKAGVVLAFPIGAALGFSMTPTEQQPPEPETRIVRLPPKVETKEVIKEVEVPQPLPPSCLDAIDSTGELVTNMAKHVDKYKESYQYLDDLDMRRLNDLNAAHATEDGMNTRIMDLGTILQEVFYANHHAQTAWRICKREKK